MPLTILPIEERDTAEVAEVLYRSSLTDGIQQYVKALYPGLETVEGRAQSAARFLRIRKALTDPSQFIKVVDEQTGAMMAWSIMLFYAEPPKSVPPLSGVKFPTEDDYEYAVALKAQRDALFVETMGKFTGKVTEILGFFVDASQQHHGVGSFLMQHILEVNRKRGSPVVLMSNPPAVGFYVKQGYEIGEDRLFTVDDRWKDRPPARLTSMTHTL